MENIEKLSSTGEFQTGGYPSLVHELVKLNQCQNKNQINEIKINTSEIFLFGLIWEKQYLQNMFLKFSQRNQKLIVHYKTFNL